MDADIEVIEGRLKSLVGQLYAECGILERLTYKNKNQHRRCAYFKYLLKVRRDLKLLQSIHLEELLESCFHVLTGKKPKQKVHLLESLKRRKTESGKYNFMDRLLGAARLLSQMVEPIIMAATGISTLLARSFFMGFSLTVLALLARLRVLVQQILLDVVSVFNECSSLSQKKQSIKISQDGVDVFREYYPKMEEVVTLQCVWETDKFTLTEQIDKFRIKDQDGVELGDQPGTSGVRYRSVEAFLGEDILDVKNADATAEERLNYMNQKQTEAVQEADAIADALRPDDSSGALVPPSRTSNPGSISVVTSLSSSPSSSLLRSASRRKVAFISVKKPAPSAASGAGHGGNESESKSVDKEDSFFTLLTGGTMKNSLF